MLSGITFSGIPMHWPFRLKGALVALLSIAVAGASVPAPAAADEDIWPSLKTDLFGNREVVEDTSAVTLEAPYRAEDAALVPLSIRIPAAVAAHVKKLSIVIDKNPAP